LSFDDDAVEVEELPGASLAGEASPVALARAPKKDMILKCLEERKRWVWVAKLKSVSVVLESEVEGGALTRGSKTKPRQMAEQPLSLNPIFLHHSKITTARLSVQQRGLAEHLEPRVNDSLALSSDKLEHQQI
jgi:hypothetical protein